MVIRQPGGGDAVVGGAAREVPLTDGNTPGVVRVGYTVRRPLNPGSGGIHRLLAYFERCRFGGAPRFLGVYERGGEILSFIDGFAPPRNGFRLSEQAMRAGARLLRRVHDLTVGTEFAASSEVACHPNLSQPNFIFRHMIPVAIIDWDRTHPGTRLDNFAQFLWAFVHPAVYGDGEPAARMLQVAAGPTAGPGPAWWMPCWSSSRLPGCRGAGSGSDELGTGRTGAPGTQGRPVPGTPAGLTPPRCPTAPGSRWPVIAIRRRGRCVVCD